MPHEQQTAPRPRFQDRIIGQHVAGLSFADVGGLWGTNNERVTVALAAGAGRAAMIDLMAEGSPWWAKFDARAQERGFSDYARFPGANIDDPALPQRVGTFDFVNCAGILYHVPNPLLTITQLRQLTNRYLVLASMVVPETIDTEVGSMEFSDGRCIYIPAITGETKRIVAAHFARLGLHLMHISPDHPHPVPFSTGGKMNYGPWWWLYSPSTLLSMVETAGFRIIEWEWTLPEKAAAVFCEKVEA